MYVYLEMAKYENLSGTRPGWRGGGGEHCRNVYYLYFFMCSLKTKQTNLEINLIKIENNYIDILK